MASDRSWQVTANSPEGTTVCCVQCIDDDGNLTSGAEPNARLIAAAPELLEACRELVEAPSLNEDSLHDYDYIALDLAYAVIAKTTGLNPVNA